MIYKRSRERAELGISAVGSAPHWQCGGQEFESPMLHQVQQMNVIHLSAVFFA